MITIILIEPENSGNIGAIARSMANFGLSDLLLINPKCDFLSGEAIARSKHGLKVLKSAKTGDLRLLKKYGLLVGTTAKLGNDYNIPRSALTPKQLSETIRGKKTKIGIMFGREGNGLSNEELRMCDFIVSVPTSEKYPTLNISHAATIIFYEIFCSSDNKKNTDVTIPASAKEKEVMLKKIADLLDDLEFDTDDKKETQMVVWKRIAGKSMLTKREVYAVLGFVKKVRERMA